MWAADQENTLPHEQKVWNVYPTVFNKVSNKCLLPKDVVLRWDCSTTPHNHTFVTNWWWRIWIEQRLLGPKGSALIMWKLGCEPSHVTNSPLLHWPNVLRPERKLHQMIRPQEPSCRWRTPPETLEWWQRDPINTKNILIRSDLNSSKRHGNGIIPAETGLQQTGNPSIHPSIHYRATAA